MCQCAASGDAGIAADYLPSRPYKYFRGRIHHRRLHHPRLRDGSSGNSVPRFPAAPIAATSRRPTGRCDRYGNGDRTTSVGPFLDPHQRLCSALELSSVECYRSGAAENDKPASSSSHAFCRIIAGWFVARDAVNFNIIQMVVAVFLITAIVAIAAFWETLSDWFKSKNAKS